VDYGKRIIHDTLHERALWTLDEDKGNEHERKLQIQTVAWEKHKDLSASVKDRKKNCRMHSERRKCKKA
jgi:hypothetical protein